MGYFRKFDGRTYGDKKFRALSDPQPSGKYLWIYLLTGPHVTSIPGLSGVGPMALAEAIGWSGEDFNRIIKELTHPVGGGSPMVWIDRQAHVLLIPKAIRYNTPQSPNVIKHWRDQFDLITECPLRSAWVLNTLSWFRNNQTEAFIGAFMEHFGGELGAIDEGIIEGIPEALQKEFQIHTESMRKRKRTRTRKEDTPDHRPGGDGRSKKDDGIPYDEIIGFLNDTTGRKFPNCKTTRTLIRARWNEGFRKADFEAVITSKSKEWKADAKWSKYLRPSTLFGASKFPEYLGLATPNTTAKPKPKPSGDREDDPDLTEEDRIRGRKVLEELRRAGKIGQKKKNDEPKKEN